VGPAGKGFHNPKGYGLPWSIRLGQDWTARGHLLHPDRRHRGQGDREAAVVGEAHQGSGERRRVVLAAEGGLLGHLPQELHRGRLGSAGNGRWSAGMSSPVSSN
jgi:hypothetical protein